MEEGHSDGKCPGEIYNMEGAGEVLPCIYETQLDCLRAHGCVRDSCPLDASWKQHGQSEKSRSAAALEDFLVAAFLGPRKS